MHDSSSGRVVLAGVALPSRSAGAIRRRTAQLALACICICLAHSSAHAQAGAFIPASSDLLLRGRPAEGLLVLRSGYRNSPYVDVDALVFLGASTDEWRGDVLSVSVSLREPHGFGQARVGRFVLGGGAVGPVQVDGIELVARAFPGSNLALFAGLPVVPEFGARSFDWLGGGRLGQTLWNERLGFGVSYVQRRDAGELDAEELGGDASLRALPWLSLHAIGSWSLLAHGFSELRSAALVLADPWQIELFATQRIAARLLPATSLFSVISDTASTVAGGDVNWRAFPRLSFGSTLALEGLGEALGYRTTLRSTLRLADEGPGQVGIEAIRRQRGEEAYTGGALRVVVPIGLAFQTHASAELVAADHSAGRGSLWPWLRFGASWAVHPAWRLAAAVGVQSSPLYARDLYALVRASYQTELQP